MDESARAHARLLVVEDDFLIALSLQQVLEEAGHEVVALAPDHDAAVAAALAHRPDLVLMDIRLAHGSNGIAAAIEIRRRTGIRALFLTSHDSADVRLEARAAEPVGWLVKPCPARLLLEAIRQSP